MDAIAVAWISSIDIPSTSGDVFLFIAPLCKIAALEGICVTHHYHILHKYLSHPAIIGLGLLIQDGNIAFVRSLHIKMDILPHSVTVYSGVSVYIWSSVSFSPDPLSTVSVQHMCPEMCGLILDFPGIEMNVRVPISQENLWVDVCSLVWHHIKQQ